MDATPLIERILEDEGITSGLDAPEANWMIETLTRHARAIADDQNAAKRVDALCRQARRIARVAETFRDSGEEAAKTKASEYGLPWPFRGVSVPAATAAAIVQALMNDVRF